MIAHISASSSLPTGWPFQNLFRSAVFPINSS
jgi:hypothetical protein